MRYSDTRPGDTIPSSYKIVIHISPPAQSSNGNLIFWAPKYRRTMLRKILIKLVNSDKRQELFPPQPIDFDSSVTILAQNFTINTRKDNSRQLTQLLLQYCVILIGAVVHLFCFVFGQKVVSVTGVRHCNRDQTLNETLI